MRARPRKRRRTAPRPAKSTRTRDYTGWIFFILLVSSILGWNLWQQRPENWLQPVAAHSTPLARGRCAVDLRTGLVWGRVVRLGSVRGRMDQYVVQSLTRWWVMSDVPINQVRVVRCQDVTGPGTLGDRTPTR
jgi:hypothetical protein